MIAMPELKKPRLMKPEEFLDWEYHQESRYEYVEGKIIEMAGEAPEHNTIAGNAYRKIGNAIEEMPCSVYMDGVRVRVANGKFRYPDVVALCGEPQFADTRPKNLLNPQILIEVLSDSTRDIDLIDKVGEYLALVSVTDYLIFEQTQMRAYHYKPTGPQSYTTQIYTAPDSVIRLEATGVALTLSDIYRKVALPAPEPENEMESGEAQANENETESETDDAAL